MQNWNTTHSTTVCSSCNRTTKSKSTNWTNTSVCWLTTTKYTKNNYHNTSNKSNKNNSKSSNWMTKSGHSPEKTRTIRKSHRPCSNGSSNSKASSVRTHSSKPKSTTNKKYYKNRNNNSARETLSCLMRSKTTNWYWTAWRMTCISHSNNWMTPAMSWGRNNNKSPRCLTNSIIRIRQH